MPTYAIPVAYAPGCPLPHPETRTVPWSAVTKRARMSEIVYCTQGGAATRTHVAKKERLGTSACGQRLRVLGPDPGLQTVGCTRPYEVCKANGTLCTNYGTTGNQPSSSSSDGASLDACRTPPCASPSSSSVTGTPFQVGSLCDVEARQMHGRSLSCAMMRAAAVAYMAEGP